MADVFELELHDQHEEDHHAADSDDDAIEIDEVCNTRSGHRTDEL